MFGTLSKTRRNADSYAQAQTEALMPVHCMVFVSHTHHVHNADNIAMHRPLPSVLVDSDMSTITQIDGSQAYIPDADNEEECHHSHCHHRIYYHYLTIRVLTLNRNIKKMSSLIDAINKKGLLEKRLDC